MPEKFIEATQDGIVRLIYDYDNDIQGLFTRGLESCVAIIFIGDKGISLIHDTGRIRLDSILKEFRWVGNLTCWHLAFNSVKDAAYKSRTPGYNEWYPNGKFKDHYDRIIALGIPANKYYASPTIYHDAIDGFVSVTYQGDFNVSVEPENIEPPPDGLNRFNINTLNNYIGKYLSEGDESKWVLGDVQFDGKKFTNCSKLIIPITQIKHIAQHKKDDRLDKLIREVEKLQEGSGSMEGISPRQPTAASAATSEQDNLNLELIASVEKIKKITQNVNNEILAPSIVKPKNSQESFGYMNGLFSRHPTAAALAPKKDNLKGL